MRRQKEFKPDKEGAGLLARLYITQKQRRSIYKWSLYALVLLVLSVLQDVVLCRVRVLGATTDLVPCAIILICVLEGGESGAIFSLIASLLYVYSGTAPGPYCMVFLVIFSLGIRRNTATFPSLRMTSFLRSFARSLGLSELR